MSGADRWWRRRRGVYCDSDPDTSAGHDSYSDPCPGCDCDCDPDAKPSPRHHCDPDADPNPRRHCDPDADQSCRCHPDLHAYPHYSTGRVLWRRDL